MVQKNRRMRVFSAFQEPKRSIMKGRRRLLFLLFLSGFTVVCLCPWLTKPPPAFSSADESSSLQRENPEGRASIDPKDFFTIDEMAKWKRYRLQKLWLHLIGLGSLLAFYFLFLLFGFNRILKEIALRLAGACSDSRLLCRTGNRFPALRTLAKLPERIFGGQEGLVVLAYTGLFVLVIRLVFFPQSFAQTFWFEHHYGLSTTSIALWLFDYAKSLLLGTIVLSFMVFGIYGLLNRVGDRWWLLLWAGVSVGIVGYAYIAPYRAHLYSNFHPLESGELRGRLEELAERQGVQIEDILVVDASRRTKKVNAYFTGSGATRRIVLFDTLVEQFTPREIVLILAHELAHRSQGGETLSYLIFSLTAFMVLSLANQALRRGSRMDRLHYSSPRDVAGLPVLFLTFFLAFEILRPANCVWKRARELEADRRSLEMVCDPDAFLGIHVKLSRLNYSDVTPHPLVVFLFYSHPPFLQRAELAQSVDCLSRGVSP